MLGEQSRKAAVIVEPRHHYGEPAAGAHLTPCTHFPGEACALLPVQQAMVASACDVHRKQAKPDALAGFEYVVKNVMYHLGPQDWALYVFHGNRNEAFVRRSLAGIENVKVKTASP